MIIEPQVRARAMAHRARQARDKPPLDRETLRDVIDLSLWTGQLLLQREKPVV
ncbi:MAG: hypothetical protein GYB67_08935 [Chloroflexi bacterium]|nr:hypothetical protein [Chloroflexota bacterium]